MPAMFHMDAAVVLQVKFTEISCKAVEMFSKKDPECRSIFCLVLLYEH